MQNLSTVEIVIGLLALMVAGLRVMLWSGRWRPSRPQRVLIYVLFGGVILLAAVLLLHPLFDQYQDLAKLPE